MEQEFKDKLSQDKTLQAQVLDVLKGTDVGKAYAETIAKNYFDENISQEHKKIYDFVDNALTGAGLEKPQGVKTSEWAKMIAEQNKELTEKLSSLKSNTNPDETLKKLEELKAKHKKEKADPHALSVEFRTRGFTTLWRCIYKSFTILKTTSTFSFSILKRYLFQLS